MNFLNFRKSKLAYTILGKGKPVLFIHGMVTDSRSIEKFTKELSKNYKVISMDLPSHGQSTYHSLKLKNILECHKALIQHLNVSEYYCIGYSLGAAIASALAIKDNNIKKTILVVPIISKKHSSKILTETLFECIKELKVSPTQYFRKSYEKSLSPFRSEKRTENRVKDFLSQSKRTWLEGFVWSSQTNVRENIQKLGDSCLIIVGDHDIMAPLKYAKEIAFNLEIINANHSDIDKEHMKFGKNNLFVNFFDKTN